MSDTTESHSDIGESTTDSWSSSEWSMVDFTSHLQDEESGSTTSSVEVVEEEEDLNDQRTPLSGNSPPGPSTPLFVLRLASRIHEDADDEQSVDVESVTDSQLYDVPTPDTSISAVDTTIVQSVDHESSPPSVSDSGAFKQCSPPASLAVGEKETGRHDTEEDHITDSQLVSQVDSSLGDEDTGNAQSGSSPNTGWQCQDVPRDQIDSLVQVLDNVQVSLKQSLPGSRCNPASAASVDLSGNGTKEKETPFEKSDAARQVTKMQDSPLDPQDQSPEVSSSEGTALDVSQPGTSEVQQSNGFDAVDRQDSNEEEQEAVSSQSSRFLSPWVLAIAVAIVAIVTGIYMGPIFFATKSKIEVTQEGFCSENLRSCRKDLDSVQQENLELRKNIDQHESTGDFREDNSQNEKLYTQAEFDEALKASIKQKESDFSKIEFEKVLDYIWLKVQERQSFSSGEQPADGEGKSKAWAEDGRQDFWNAEDGAFWKGLDTWWDIQTKVMEEYKNLKGYLPQDLLTFLSKLTGKSQSSGYDDVAADDDVGIPAGTKRSQQMEGDDTLTRPDDSHAREKKDKGRSQTNSKEESGQSREGGFEPGFWADSVLDMVNNTKGQIEDIWMKVKNMSDNLLKKHEPSLKKIQNKFVKRVHQLSEKFQTKLAKKVKKWFGSRKKEDDIRQQGTLKRQGVKTKRREYVGENGEEFLSRGGKCTDPYNGRECDDIYKDKAVDNVQEEKYVEEVPEEVHVRWSNGVPDERPDSHIDEDDGSEEEYDDDDDDDDDGDDDNWYIARAKDREYYHTEPEDWYFQRFKKDMKPMMDRKTAKTGGSDEAIDDNWYMRRAENREYHHELPDDWYFRKFRDENYHMEEDVKETGYPNVNKEHSKYGPFQKHGRNKKGRNHKSYHA